MSKVNGSKSFSVKSFCIGLFNGLAKWPAQWAQSPKIDGSKPFSVKFSIFCIGLFNGLAQRPKWWAQASEVDGSKALSLKFLTARFRKEFVGGCSQTNRL